MNPRPPIRPNPPAGTIRAMVPSELRPDTGFPILARYLHDLARIHAWKVLVLHYGIVLALLFGFYFQATGGDSPHPEILLKLIGAYCFLVGTIAIPLVSPLLFPDIGETDPAFDTVPGGPIRLFDARLSAQMIVSAFALLPVLPIFVLFDPFTGSPSDPFDIFPFFQGVLASGWVQIVMDIATPIRERSGNLARRLGVVGIFVLLHISLIGLLAQLAFYVIQRANPMKLIIDLNPFSQLYILMEGVGQRRLLFNTYPQNLIDFRLYMFIIQAIAFSVLLWVWRSWLKSRSDVRKKSA